MNREPLSKATLFDSGSLLVACQPVLPQTAVESCPAHPTELRDILEGQFLLLPSANYLTKVLWHSNSGLPNRTPLALAAAIPSA